MDHEYETTLTVEGMTCGACVRHVRQALTAVAGVNEIDIALAEGKVTVRHQREAAPVATLVETLSDAGYVATVAP